MGTPNEPPEPPVVSEMGGSGPACLGLVAMALLLVATIVYRAGVVDFDLDSLWNPEAPPIPEPERFVRISFSVGDSEVTEEKVARWLESQVSLERVALCRSGKAAMDEDGAEPRTFPAAEVSSAFFEAVGVAPMLGRTFAFLDFDRRQPVVVISHEVWTGWLGADPGMIGATVEFGGREMIIIGVMPEGFSFPGGRQVWLAMGPGGVSQLDATGGVEVLGKLNEGVTWEQANAELQRLVARGLGGAEESALDVEVSPWFGD